METIRVRKLNHANLHVDCESGTAHELNEFFSFYVPGYKFMPAFRNRLWDGKIRLYNMMSGELPAGLYPHLLKFSEQREYEVECIDSKYGLPEDYNKIDVKEIYEFIKKLELPFKIRDYQFDAVTTGIHRKRGILLSPTGSGKSLIIYALAMYWLMRLTTGLKFPKGGRVLVIVPTTSLVEQMYNDFKEYGCPEGAMHKIYSGKDKTFEAAICISTWQSIYKLPRDWFSQFGMVVGDECHGFKSKSLMSIMNKASEAEYRFGTTGTLDGAQTHELVLQGLFGKIYRVTTTKSLQDNDTLAQLEIKRIVLNYAKEIRSEFGKRTYQDEIQYIISNEQRNKFIRNLTLDLRGNTLVLYQRVEDHGKILYQLIKEKSPEDRKVFFVSGGTDTTDREAIRGIVEKMQNAIVVASLGTFSTGINIRNLHNIVFASPSKSQIRVLQSIGRGLRKSDDEKATVLYDISDDLSIGERKNYSLLHSFERMKIYKKEQFNVKTFKVDI